MTKEALAIISIVMGCITFVFYCASLIPQAIQLRKTRNTSGISLLTFAICFVDNIFWIAWALGFYFNSMLMYDGQMNRIFQCSILIICFLYIYGTLVSAYILAVKLVHLYKAKQLKISELVLAKILLDKDKKRYFIDHKWNNFKRYFTPSIVVVLSLLCAFVVSAILYVFAYWKPVAGTKEWTWVIVVSCIASVIWEITCWPQLIKSIREKDTTGMSIFWCCFSMISTIINFIYDLVLAFSPGGFNRDVLFILIFSAIIPHIGIFVIKLKNVLAAKKAGMSEVEYTKKVLIPLVKKKQAKKAHK